MAELEIVGNFRIWAVFDFLGMMCQFSIRASDCLKCERIVCVI